MDTSDSHRVEALKRLELLNEARYRRARWNAIHAAREAGCTWPQVADALGVQRTQAIRLYSSDAPEGDAD